MNVAVIPARGGSRRIPRKNIKRFCGRPIIAWSIAAAKDSGLFEHVLVSTDDAEIADVAESSGAEVPFRRPPELSDDYTGTTEVIAHAAQWMLNQNWPVANVCCLYPTAPFVRVSELAAGLEKLQTDSWKFCFTATEYPSPIFRSFRQNSAGGVEMFFPEHFNKRSQDLPEALHDAGQFYWGRREAWIEQAPLFAPTSSPLVIPRWRVHDIDTEEDWERAELVWNALFSRDG